MEDVERSDRELARLFVEMFDVIGESVVRYQGIQQIQRSREHFPSAAFGLEYTKLRGRLSR